MSGSVLLALIGAISVSAADWPQWRGPERTGRVTATPGLPAALPDALPVRWKVKAGEGFASPVVAGTRVFLFDNQDGKETLRALSTEDGRDVWRTAVDDCFKDSQGPPGPRCTPVIDGDRVYAQSCQGELQCLSVAEGAKIWSVSFTRDFGAVFTGEKGNAPGATRHGNNGAPLIVGDVLYASVGSTQGAGMVAFDKRTGAVRWKSGNEIAAYAAPAITRVAQPAQVVNFMADGVLGFAAESGQGLWKFPLKTAFARHVMSPILFERDTLVVVGSHQTGLVGVRISSRDGQFTATEAWKNMDAAPNFSNGFELEGTYYGLGPNQTLVAVDLTSGALRWKHDAWIATSADKAHAAFIYDGARSLALLDDGQLVLWEPRPTGYRETGRVQVCGVNWCQPALADGRLYVRDGLKGTGQLMCLELGGR
jgi:outer membrane protein assembly factor BamB